MKLSEAAALYIQLREKKSALKAKYDEEKGPIEAKMEKLEALMLGVFDKNGIESVKTPAGTPYITTRTSVTTADKDVFMTHVRSNLAWDLLEVRPSKSAVDTYMQEHGDAPPGVNVRTERVINVRKSD